MPKTFCKTVFSGKGHYEEQVLRWPVNSIATVLKFVSDGLANGLWVIKENRLHSRFSRPINECRNIIEIQNLPWVPPKFSQSILKNFR